MRLGYRRSGHGNHNRDRKSRIVWLLANFEWVSGWIRGSNPGRWTELRNKAKTERGSGFCWYRRPYYRSFGRRGRCLFQRCGEGLCDKGRQVNVR